MKRAVLALGGLLLAACAREPAPADPGAKAPTTEETASPPAEAASIIPAPSDLPAGRYTLDKAHASITFTVDHIGFSDYTGQFDDFDATLQFDPSAPETMQVEATINPLSVDVPSPPAGFLDELKGSTWLDAGANPEISFRSTRVTLTAPDAARVDGALSLRGVTQPVSMDVRFRGGYVGFPPYDPNPRIGFSANGSLSRSAFGVTFGLPGEEFPIGVGDRVSFAIEAEFNGPPAPAP